MTPPHLTAKIARELYIAMERLSADPELLSILSSWGDTLNDEEILALLPEYNATGGSCINGSKGNPRCTGDPGGLCGFPQWLSTLWLLQCARLRRLPHPPKQAVLTEAVSSPLRSGTPPFRRYCTEFYRSRSQFPTNAKWRD
jgi:hypothetical protein